MQCGITNISHPKSNYAFIDKVCQGTPKWCIVGSLGSLLQQAHLRCIKKFCFLNQDATILIIVKILFQVKFSTLGYVQLEKRRMDKKV